jgi:TolA-binding protein
MVLEMAQTFPDDNRKASALIDIADSLAENGQTEKAAEILEEALVLVGL